VASSSPVSGPKLASSRHRPPNVRDRYRAWAGSGWGSRSALAHSRQAAMAVATSRTDNSTKLDTISVSWSANNPTVSPSRLAAIASTWPLESTPSRHAAAVTGRWASLRARDTVAAARARGMAARSVSQAVMEVAPSSSHSPAWSWAATAWLMRASSRSRNAKMAVRAAPSAGMSSSSITVPSSSNILVSYTCSPTRIKQKPRSTPFSGRELATPPARQAAAKPGSRAAARPAQRTLDAGAPKPPTVPTITQAPAPGPGPACNG
jgi:hypothetical protein